MIDAPCLATVEHSGRTLVDFRLGVLNSSIISNEGVAKEQCCVDRQLTMWITGLTASSSMKCV